MLGRTLLLVVAPISLSSRSARDSTVSATATQAVRLTPDLARLHLSVEGTAEAGNDAVTRAAEKAPAVSEALGRSAAGIDVGPTVPLTVGTLCKTG